jgi:hypothetical protein
MFLIKNSLFSVKTKNRESWTTPTFTAKGKKSPKQRMTALHFRDSMQDLLLHPSAAIRKNTNASAVCPFSKTGISVPSVWDTDTHRASIDSQYFVQLGVRYHAFDKKSTLI